MRFATAVEQFHGVQVTTLFPKHDTTFTYTEYCANARLDTAIHRDTGMRVDIEPTMCARPQQYRLS